jgi:inhibitor of KinA sporulation pathway (predicted exonuclease)
VTRRREYVTEIRPTDMNPIFKHVHECLTWVESKQVDMNPIFKYVHECLLWVENKQVN